ncbi:hypothetical protein [Paraburkholderia ultramafica]|uniref:hypothetical protein n=1 Tax=Paraburkholderia ultramafica TaxID=1544867 RepID=UPI0015816E4C|nr:hypothetical protein [Paraburkholderia ultramafica]
MQILTHSIFERASNIDGLIVSIVNKRGLPYSKNGIYRFSSESIGRNLSTFIARELDFSQLPDRSARGESLLEYRKSGGQNITPRHGRKTFAAYILESRSSLLEAVKDHFKHISTATTETAYFPQSARLREDIESVVVSETIAFFVDVLEGKKLVGRMGPAIQRYFGEESFASVEDVVELEKRVSTIVLAHDLRIYFFEYGKCFIKADPLHSRCRELEGGVGWDKTVPAFSVCCPSLCAGCKVFAADSTNLPFWKRRLAQCTEALERAKRDGHEREYRVHLARAQQAEKIIDLIGKKRG